MTKNSARLLWAITALLLSGVIPATTAAAEQKPMVAIIPVKGPLPPQTLAQVTAGFRAQFKRRGYAPIRQHQVRAASDAAAAHGRDAQRKAAQIASDLGAELVIAAVFKEPSATELELKVYAYDAHRRQTVGYAARGIAAEEGHPDNRSVAVAMAGCIAAVVGQPFKPPADSPVVLTPFHWGTPAATQPVVAAAHAKQTPTTPPTLKPAPVSQPTALLKTEKPSSEFWDSFDHGGLFADGSFVFSWCKGDELCGRGEAGYGARGRLGYRILSRVSLFVTGAFAIHQLPSLEQFQSVESISGIDTTYVWFGFFGGLRIHPINHFLLDPYVGLQVGHTWLFYNEPMEAAGGSITVEGVTVDIPAGAYQRVNLNLKGVTIVPEIGLQVFLAPPLALSVNLAWVVPFWSEVCRSVVLNNGLTDEIAGGREGCFSLDDAAASEAAGSPVDTLKPNLHRRDALPEYLSLELGLTLQF